MKPNLIYHLLAAAAISPVITSCAKPEKTEAKKPNIIFILADDMGYGDLSCFNKNSKIATPNIDRLANTGVTFTNAHSPAAWCVPSRYGLLTGTYPGRVQLNWQERSLVEPGQETLATLMKRNGYQTACVGKWHLGFDNINWKETQLNDTLIGGPVERGFDYYFGLHASLDIPPYFYIENNRLVERATSFVDDHASDDATSAISGAFWRKGACSPNFHHEEVLDKLTQKADSFITSHQTSNSEEPFFLYFPLTAPHTPWLPKEAYRGKSGAGEFGDFVMQVDDVVGNIVSLLEEQGIRENTLIIFTSDNGPVWFNQDIERFGHDSKGGLKGMKIDLWEGGSKVPFIANWPGRITEGAKTDQLFCFTDVMATFASLVGATDFDQSNFDSFDFTPALFHPESEDTIRHELVIDRHVFRKDDYKLILGSGLGGLSKTYDPDGVYLPEAGNEGELYQLSDDPAETTSLYEQQPGRVEEMKAAFDQYHINQKQKDH